jgi:hypothetical protein
MGKLAHVIKRIDEINGKEPAVDESELMQNIGQLIAGRNKSDDSRNNGITLQRLEESLSKSGNSQTETNKMILGLVGLVMEQGDKIDELKKQLNIPPESVKPELEKLSAKLDKPKEWTFNVIRDSEGHIEHVVASSDKPKPVNGVFQGVQS